MVRADDSHEIYTAMFPEHALPEGELLPAEQVWSNLVDPVAAAVASSDRKVGIENELLIHRRLFLETPSSSNSCGSA